MMDGNFYTKNIRKWNYSSDHLVNRIVQKPFYYEIQEAGYIYLKIYLANCIIESARRNEILGDQKLAKVQKAEWETKPAATQISQCMKNKHITTSLNKLLWFNTRKLSEIHQIIKLKKNNYRITSANRESSWLNSTLRIKNLVRF